MRLAGTPIPIAMGVLYCILEGPSRNIWNYRSAQFLGFSFCLIFYDLIVYGEISSAVYTLQCLYLSSLNAKSWFFLILLKGFCNLREFSFGISSGFVLLLETYLLREFYEDATLSWFLLEPAEDWRLEEIIFT